MGTGILICGLNGAGKSTLGKALAEKLHFNFIDNEDLYFPKTDPLYLYASPRPRHEVERILLREIRTHENFVFTSVKGDYGKAVCSYFDYIVWITAPGGDSAAAGEKPLFSEIWRQNAARRGSA